MVLCDTCKHLGNMASWPCEDCLQGDRYERKPTTNADRIRAMSDEELAEFLAEHQKIGDVEEHGDEYRQLWLDWLKQEVSPHDL